MARMKATTANKVTLEYCVRDVYLTLQRNGGDPFAIDEGEIKSFLFSAQAELAEKMRNAAQELVLARFGEKANIAPPPVKMAKAKAA